MEQPELSKLQLHPIENRQPYPSVRLLKIEADGDRWKGIKPKIRLMGVWLERAGFRPGHRVQITCVAPGVMELRSPDASSISSESQPISSEEPSQPF